MKWDPFGIKFFILKMQVGALADAAQGHESNGLPPGSPEYQALHDQALIAVAKYRQGMKDGGPATQYFYARLPVLRVMDRLAHPRQQQPQKKAAGLAIGVATLALALPLLIGLWCGVVSWAYHLIGR
jgi:hypothetical protein